MKFETLLSQRVYKNRNCNPVLIFFTVCLSVPSFAVLFIPSLTVLASYFYVSHCLNFYKFRDTVSLNSTFVCFFQVTGLSLSPGDDQLLVIHLQHNDLVICLFSQSKANRVSELMANLYLQIYQ